MSRNIQKLVPEFRDKVTELIGACAERGVVMVPYFTLRTVDEQARLWRQSRSRAEVLAQIEKFEHQGAFFLAGRLRAVGSQHGPPVTNALPGMSWHQWGEAVDCFWLRDGKAEWNNVRKFPTEYGKINGYQVYAEEARKIGLTAGHFWPKFRDSPHVQLKKESSPRTKLTVMAIDTAMARRFAGQN